MSDSKGKYSSSAASQRALAQLDAELKRKLDRASARTAKYHSNWQTVNLNDFVDKFALGSTAELHGGKIYFQTPGSKLRVVCDVQGGYCRLQDTSIKNPSHSYLDINGNNANNEILPSGKQIGRKKPEYNKVTHFRILKREEM